jgi:hypothetical protein
MFNVLRKQESEVWIILCRWTKGIVGNNFIMENDTTTLVYRFTHFLIGKAFELKKIEFQLMTELRKSTILLT